MPLHLLWFGRGYAEKNVRCSYGGRVLGQILDSNILVDTHTVSMKIELLNKFEIFSLQSGASYVTIFYKRFRFLLNRPLRMTEDIMLIAYHHHQVNLSVMPLHILWFGRGTGFEYRFWVKGFHIENVKCSYESRFLAEIVDSNILVITNCCFEFRDFWSNMRFLVCKLPLMFMRFRYLLN